jgi:hypothetical protein
MQDVEMREKEGIAPESSRTKKAREKLQQQWEQDALLITAPALAASLEKIYQWIALNAGHRVVLRNKEIHLFDQNQNAAALSRKVQEIARKMGSRET